MNRFAIVQRGVSKAGKTTTIRWAFDYLITHFPEAVIEGRHTLKADVHAVVTVGGLAIGFESQGDPCSRQPESLDRFVARECDIIVCACRSRGDTFNAVSGLAAYGYELRWRDRQPVYAPEAQHAANARETQLIIEQIEKALADHGHGAAVAAI